MPERSSQLPLELPHATALGEDDLAASPANAAAIDFVSRWPDWPSHAVVLIGPEGAGKTHLATIWAERAGARIVAADADESGLIPPGEPVAPVVVEDVDRGVGDQRALFHLLNAAREHRSSVLLTSRVAMGNCEFALPDLRSRLRSFPAIQIASPDDALLKAVLVKQFADRQTVVSPSAIDYLARHMNRSMAAARDIVALADRFALERRSPVTRSLARLVLEALSDAGDPAE